MFRTYSSWTVIVSFISTQPFHLDYTYPKGALTHPSQSGFKQSSGELKGQVADWRMTLPDRSGVHVIEFQDAYVVHRDKRCPLVDRLGHIVQDAPHWIPVIAAGVALSVVFLGSLFHKD